MASQPVFPSYSPVPFPAPKPNIRVAFVAGEAAQAINEPGAVDPAVRDATLDELVVAGLAEELVAKARLLLSPHVFTAFLRWAEAASIFSTTYQTDEEGEDRCRADGRAVEALAAASALNKHDHALKDYVLALQLTDSSCFGPLDRSFELLDGTTVTALVRGLVHDLDRLSPLPDMLDSLSAEAWRLAGNPCAWSLQVGEAITAVFARAAVVDTAARADGPTTLALMPDGYRPFMRSPWIAWQRATERHCDSRAAAERHWREAMQPANASLVDGLPGELERPGYKALEAEQERLWDAECEDRIAMYLVPAPSATELAIKLDMFQRSQDWQLTKVDKIVARLAADARRFGGLGAYPQADQPIMELYSRLRRDGERWFAQGSVGSPQDDANVDETLAAENAMFDGPAHAVEGVIARLRVFFQHYQQTNWADHAVIDPKHPDFVAGLRDDASPVDRRLWCAIEDLARIAGVNLSEQGA